jgi:hypothetical protein
MTIGEGSIIIRNLIEFQRIHYIWLHLNRKRMIKKPIVCARMLHFSENGCQKFIKTLYVIHINFQLKLLKTLLH